MLPMRSSPSCKVRLLMLRPVRLLALHSGACGHPIRDRRRTRRVCQAVERGAVIHRAMRLLHHQALRKALVIALANCRPAARSSARAHRAQCRPLTTATPRATLAGALVIPAPRLIGLAARCPALRA